MGGVVEAIYVCMTSFQYIVADLMAKEKYKKNRTRATIILKYVMGVTPMDTEYAEYIIIRKGKFGRFKTLWFSIRLGFGWYGKDLYFFNDRDPITKNIARRCRKKILVEEGVGTYFAMPGVKAIGNEIVPDEAYVGYPEVYKSTHQDKCKINKIAYDLIFSKENIKSYLWCFSFRLSCDVLLLGQTTDTNPEYREYENQFIMEFTRRFPNKKIIIKPHPRDSRSDEFDTNDNTLLIDKRLASFPIEIFMQAIEVKSVFSLFSSGCITLANIYPSVYMLFGCGLYDLGLDELIEKLRFFAIYNENIRFLNSFSDLDTIFEP